MSSAAITITIAGISIKFIIKNTALTARIRNRYAGWITKGLKPLITLMCTTTRKTGPGRSSLPKVTLAGPDRGHCMRSDFDCCWDQGQGTITLRGSVYSFDACLRVLLSTLLPWHDGLLIHASAVAAANGCGYVFAGTSGSGKTTIARLLHTASVLNDELCVVRTDRKRQVTVTGTPFWGEMRQGPAHSGPFRLVVLYFPKKAPVTRRERLNRRVTFGRLLGCICFFSKKAEETDRILGVVERIIGFVPAYDLHFRRVAEEVAAVAFSKGGCRAV
jgi:hypothetical protein